MQTGEIIGYIPQRTPSQTAPSKKELIIRKPQIYRKQDISIPIVKPLPPLPLASQPPQPFDSKKKVAVNASIEWELGWVARWPFREGLYL